MNRANEGSLLRPILLMREDMVCITRDILDRHLRNEKLSDVELAAITAKKEDAPQYEVVNGTARIPIYGVISKRINLINRISSPGTSTLEIEKDLKAAIEDPSVKDILLDIDSPGGTIDGVIECSDLIYSCRRKKPIAAYANGDMCSAAYWIGSSADKVYASRGADVGSIGVYSAIYDYTVANHNAGVKTEIIKAGKNKAVGHPDKPMSSEDREIVQKRIDNIYNLFVEAIARNRNMSIDKVLEVATGDVFMGKDAVEAGLVDEIRTFDSLFTSQKPVAAKKNQAIAEGPGSGVEIEGKTEKETLTEEASMEAKSVTVDQLKVENKAVADALIAEGKQQGLAEGKAAGIAEAKDAETKRVAGIIGAMPQKMESIAMEAIKTGKSVEETQQLYLKALQGSGAPDVSVGADTGKSHMERAKEYMALHKCSMTQALSATWKPGVKK